MPERKDLITLTFAKYHEPASMFIRKMGMGRFAIEIGKFSLIVELWFLR